MTAHHVFHGYGAGDGLTVGGNAIFFITALAVNAFVGGADVVQVRAGTGGVKAAQALGPYMLTVPATAVGNVVDVVVHGDHIAGVGQIDGGAICILAVGLYRQVTAFVVAGLVSVSFRLKSRR